MVDLVSLARPILAGREAIGEASGTAADAVATDDAVDAGPAARVGATLYGADDLGEAWAGTTTAAGSVPDAAGEAASDAVDGAVDVVPAWAGPAVFAAIAAIIVAAFSYAVGQLFTFGFGS